MICKDNCNQPHRLFEARREWSRRSTFTCTHVLGRLVILTVSTATRPSIAGYCDVCTLLVGSAIRSKAESKTIDIREVVVDTV